MMSSGKIFFPIAILTAGACLSPALQSAFSQSGRSVDPKTQKTDYHGPTPKILAQSKQSENTIRINSDLVNVIVTVGGKPPNVPLDLKMEDFEILEDGLPQEISNFSRDADQPLKMVMLYDTSYSVSPRINFERRAAARFFERVMREQDQAAVFSVSTEVVILQQFTNQIPMLMEATRQLKAQGATSLYDAIYQAADYLKPAQGRRVIVIVSDGGDTTSNKGLLEALTEAQKSDSVIFAVFTGNPFPSENLRDLAGQRALETLTKETGGELFKPKSREGRQDDNDEASLKELDQIYTDLVDRLRTQYVLGFYSTNEKRDGSFRKLGIRIKKPNYIASARTGYYAPKD